VVAVAALAACTSGGKAGQRPATTPGAAAGPSSLRVNLVTSAQATDHGVEAKRVARRAAPGLERFLDRYLTVAFLDAAGKPLRSSGLLALFDKPVRAAAGRQLDALSLGADAAKVAAVRPDRADARAVLLVAGERPTAATVRLAFDGTASGGQAGQVHLRSVFQLLATPDGWRIAGFSSRTGSAG